MLSDLSSSPGGCPFRLNQLHTSSSPVSGMTTPCPSPNYIMLIPSLPASSMSVRPALGELQVWPLSSLLSTYVVVETSAGMYHAM